MQPECAVAYNARRTVSAPTRRIVNRTCFFMSPFLWTICTWGTATVSDRGNLLLRGIMEGETYQYSTVEEFEVHHLADVDGPIRADSAVSETTFDFETQNQ